MGRSGLHVSDVDTLERNRRSGIAGIYGQAGQDIAMNQQQAQISAQNQSMQLLGLQSGIYGGLTGGSSGGQQAISKMMQGSPFQAPGYASRGISSLEPEQNAIAQLQQQLALLNGGGGEFGGGGVFGKWWEDDGGGAIGGAAAGASGGGIWG